MNRRPAFLFVLFAVATSAATARALTVPPPDPGTTVYITRCGTNPQVTVGSSPYSGSVIPDIDTQQCSIYFDADPDPFQVIIDGSSGNTGDYIAPVCKVQIQGPRTNYTIAVTAAGIHAIWDHRIAEPVIPPQLLSWVCYYPWKPTAPPGPTFGRKLATSPRTSSH